MRTGQTTRKYTRHRKDGKTFSVWIPRFLASLQTANYSGGTIAAYEKKLRKWAKYKTYLAEHDGDQPENLQDLERVGMTAPVDAKPREIEEYLTQLRIERGIGPETLRVHLAALGSFYGFLQEQGCVTENPVRKIALPKQKNRELKYLHHEEVMAMLEKIQNPRDKTLIRTIYATGMRVSEICGLCIEHIRFEDQTIRVYGKGGKIRSVICDEETLAMIREHLEDRNTGPVFLGLGGRKAISTQNVEYILRKYAPQGITPHKLRHSYATELYNRTKNLVHVQENLGHNSVQTTSIYLHANLEERRRAYLECFPLAQSSSRSQYSRTDISADR